MNQNPSRLLYIDVLRGCALFGISIVNIWYFADSYFGADLSHPEFQTKFDIAIRFVNAMLFEAKFYLLFSFLFGYSFYLQLKSVERAGARFLPRMLRRLSGLLVLGLIHGCLLYDAEILSLYACCGLVLFLLRHKKTTTLIVTACVLLCFSASIWLVLAQFAELEPELQGDLKRLLAFQSSAKATLVFHIQNLPEMLGNLIILQSASVLAMFMLGYCCARENYLALAMRNSRLLRERFMPWLAYLFPFALLSAIFYAYTSQTLRFSTAEIWAYGLQQLTAPVLSASYMLMILIWVLKRPDSALLQKIAYAGKFALSNYLMQSLIFSLIFTAYGFALIDQLAPWQVYVLVLLSYLLQLQLSHCWGHYFQHGPAEFILRAITLWRIPEFRKADSARLE